jgi:hypothetical protein
MRLIMLLVFVAAAVAVSVILVRSRSAVEVWHMAAETPSGEGP